MAVSLSRLSGQLYCTVVLQFGASSLGALIEPSTWRVHPSAVKWPTGRNSSSCMDRRPRMGRPAACSALTAPWPYGSAGRVLSPDRTRAPDSTRGPALAVSLSSQSQSPFNCAPATNYIITTCFLLSLAICVKFSNTFTFYSANVFTQALCVEDTMILCLRTQHDWVNTFVNWHVCDGSKNAWCRVHKKA